MNVLHMQLSGGFGGIATLSREINKFSDDNNVFVFLFEGGCIADEIKNTGTPVYILESSHFFSWKAKHEYLEICKKNSIDVVVSHTGCFMEFQILLYLKKRIPKLKVFMYEHCDMKDAIGYGWKGKVNLFFYKRCFSMAEKGIAISSYVKSTALQLTPGETNKIDVIYNGINLEKFNYIQRKRTKCLRLVYVGRLIYMKGCRLLIQAVSELIKDIQVKVVFVGTGDDMQVCRELADKLNVQDNIQFVGQSNQVIDYLQAADVFVHPAVCSEGFGITLIEAMATGLPCIAFKKGAIPELITNGREGFLTDDDTVKGLVKMIAEMYEKLLDGSIEQMSKAATEKAKKFDIKTTARKLHMLYDKER